MSDASQTNLATGHLRLATVLHGAFWLVVVAAIATVVTAGSVQVLQASGASAGGDALPRQAAIGVGIVTPLASLLLIPCINHHQRAGRALYRAWADRPGVTLDKHCGAPAPQRRLPRRRLSAPLRTRSAPPPAVGCFFLRSAYCCW